MRLSRVLNIGDGSTRKFAVPFPYPSMNDVKVALIRAAWRHVGGRRNQVVRLGSKTDPVHRYVAAPDTSRPARRNRTAGRGPRGWSRRRRWVVVSVRRCENDPGRPGSLHEAVGRSHTANRLAGPVTPSMGLVVPAEDVPEVQHHPPARSAAGLAPALGPTTADRGRQLAPIDRVEPADGHWTLSGLRFGGTWRARDTRSLASPLGGRRWRRRSIAKAGGRRAVI